jgi:hypothetical protein
MALSVKLPFISRAFALPFLSALEPSKKCDEAKKRRHKTSLKWASQMVLQVRRWIGKTWPLILVGDGGYAAGWSLEVTFEETREHLGVETQRQWSDRAISRSTPVLMGLYSCVCMMANRLRQVNLIKVGATAWHQKEQATFSDMLRAVRMVIWRDNLISRKGKTTPSVENITPEMLDWADDIVRRVLQAA